MRQCWLMKNEKMKTIGIVNASPAEFVIHQRMGKIRHPGRGISFFKLPWIDRYTIIPSSTRTIQFKADQITAENQGVEISGFAAGASPMPGKQRQILISRTLRTP